MIFVLHFVKCFVKTKEEKYIKMAIDRVREKNIFTTMVIIDEFCSFKENAVQTTKQKCYRGIYNPYNLRKNGQLYISVNEGIKPGSDNYYYGAYRELLNELDCFKSMSPKELTLYYPGLVEKIKDVMLNNEYVYISDYVKMLGKNYRTITQKIVTGSLKCVKTTCGHTLICRNELPFDVRTIKGETTKNFRVTDKFYMVGTENSIERTVDKELELVNRLCEESPIRLGSIKKLNLSYMEYNVYEVKVCYDRNTICNTEKHVKILRDFLKDY